MSIEVALKAAELDIDLRERARKIGIGEPSLLDAIVLATAMVLDASLITEDEHLKGRPDVIWIGGG
ncbi:hypothetical protein KEJ13_08675 [Candidatus Bathyarchaeota archaeon]|nr:hypothetical protein [Candidatus Bathyarchaeota archaeon]